MSHCPHLGESIEKCKVVCAGGRKRYTQAFRCDLHGRCLPHYVPPNIQQWNDRKPESDIYTLCHGCPDSPLTDA